MLACARLRVGRGAWRVPTLASGNAGELIKENGQPHGEGAEVRGKKSCNFLESCWKTYVRRHHIDANKIRTVKTSPVIDSAPGGQATFFSEAAT